MLSNASCPASLHQLRWWASLHLSCVYRQQCEYCSEYLHSCAIVHHQRCRRVRTWNCSLASSTIWCASKSNHCTPPTLSLTILNCLLMIMRGLLGPSLFKRANLPLMHLGWPFQCIRVTVDLLVSCHDKSAHLMFAVEFQSSAVMKRQKLLILFKGEMDVSKVKGQ